MVKQFCTFYLGDQFYGVEVEKVQEVLRFQEMTRVPLAPRVVKGLINLRGQIVTAIDLREYLEPDLAVEHAQAMNVVVRSEDGPISFLVDEIGDVVEVGEEDFEQAPETVRGIARELIKGIYKIADRLLLVLDTERAAEVEKAEA